MVLLRGKVSWALSEGPGSAIRINGLAASQTQLFACFLVSYIPLARSAFGQAQRALIRASWRRGGNSAPGCSALTRQSLEPINGDGKLLIYGLTRRRPAARAAGRRPRRSRRDGRRVSGLSRRDSWPAFSGAPSRVRVRGAWHNSRRIHTYIRVRMVHRARGDSRSRQTRCSKQAWSRGNHPFISA